MKLFTCTKTFYFQQQLENGVMIWVCVFEGQLFMAPTPRLLPGNGDGARNEYFDEVVGKVRNIFVTE